MLALESRPDIDVDDWKVHTDTKLFPPESRTSDLSGRLCAGLTKKSSGGCFDSQRPFQSASWRL